MAVTAGNTGRVHFALDKRSVDIDFVLDLAIGEVAYVDTGCLVGFTRYVDYDIEMIKGVRNVLFGGEGLFYARLCP